MSYKHTTLALIPAILLTLGGCQSSSNQQSAYHQPPSTTIKKVYYGVITQAHFVSIPVRKKEKRRRGRSEALGTALGAVVGSRDGFFGAVFGGVVGNAVGRSIDKANDWVDRYDSSINGQQLHITLEDGDEIIAIQVFQEGGEPFVTGNEVRVVVTPQGHSQVSLR